MTMMSHMVLPTYHNHHTFIEQLLRNKDPKDIIEEGTTEQHCSNLANTQIQSSERNIQLEETKLRETTLATLNLEL